jgi:hypothetical protein
MTDDELPVELVKAVRQAQARDELGWASRSARTRCRLRFAVPAHAPDAQ